MDGQCWHRSKLVQHATSMYASSVESNGMGIVHRVRVHLMRRLGHN